LLRDRKDARDADHRRGIAQDEAHAGHQGVGGENGVGIDAEHVPIAGEVECAVQRIGLAAVLLVDHDQPRIGLAAVDPTDPLRLEPLAVEDVARLELERLPEDVERPVRGAVVDHDHFELGIVVREHRAHRVHDRHLLVEGGEEDADGDREMRIERAGKVLGVALSGPEDTLEDRDRREREEARVDGPEIAEAGIDRPTQHLLEGHEATASLGS
jgi:hypothetical protein